MEYTIIETVEALRWNSISQMTWTRIHRLWIVHCTQTLRTTIYKKWQPFMVIIFYTAVTNLFRNSHNLLQNFPNQKRVCLITLSSLVSASWLTMQVSFMHFSCTLQKAFYMFQLIVCLKKLATVAFFFHDTSYNTRACLLWKQGCTNFQQNVMQRKGLQTKSKHKIGKKKSKQFTTIQIFLQKRSPTKSLIWCTFYHQTMIFLHNWDISYFCRICVLPVTHFNS